MFIETILLSSSTPTGVEQYSPKDIFFKHSNPYGFFIGGNVIVFLSIEKDEMPILIKYLFIIMSIGIALLQAS